MRPTRRHDVWAALLLLGFCPVALGAGPTKEKEPQQAAEPDAVDYRELKKLMPKELLGLPRASLEGEMASNETAARSSATADYEKPPEPPKQGDRPAAPQPPPPRIELQYMDHGTAPGMADAAGAWSKTERDDRNEGGYTRTYKLAGFPAIETYSVEARAGTLQIFVAQRVIVTVMAENLPPEQTRKVGEALPLAKVAALVK
jgi:hypothetical protein